MKQVSIKGDINLYSNNSLSILITQDGLSYSVYDISDNKIQILVSMQFSNATNKFDEIEKFFASENISDFNFENINVVYATKKVTIVPDAIFDEDYAKTIFATNHKINDDEEIKFSKLSKSESVIIYSVERKLIEFLDKLLSNYTLYPQSFPFIETNLTKTKISEMPNRQRMLVQVFEDFFEILIIDKAQIVNYNTYNYKSANDILYFIVNTFEQLGLSQNDCEVDFTGFIEQDSIVVIYLKKFVRTVYFESINRDYKHFYRFQEFAPHYFFNFLNIN